MAQSRALSLLGMLRPASQCVSQNQQQGSFHAFKRFFNPYQAPNGVAVSQVPIEEEWYLRQRSVIPVMNKKPFVSNYVWIAPNAVVAGDVDLCIRSSVLFGAVLRGDLNNIRIGMHSMIMDRVVIHSARTSPTGLNSSTLIGNECIVEPGSVLRSCRLEGANIVGARSVLCEGSMMEFESVLAPGSVLPPARRVPAGELWGGNPARFIRQLTPTEREQDISSAAMFAYNMIEAYRDEELPFGTQWRQVEAYRKKLVEQDQYRWVDFRAEKYHARLKAEAQALEKMAF
jgi:carbonic anhydrase/acetyltransferase-like protein (isoleucine patch superfamily)